MRANPRRALIFFFERAFSRAGGEQAGYSEIAITALKNSCGRLHGFQRFIARADSGELIWKDFVKLCVEEKKRPNEKNNKGVVVGLTRLAKKSPNQNIATRFERQISQGKLAEAYLDLIRNKGIGDKIARFLLRDFVAISGLEDQVPNTDLHFLQPVDVWVRRTAEFLWPNLSKSAREDPKDAPDWFMAQFVTEKCLRHKVSSIRFNQGAWLFGSERVKEARRLPAALVRLARES